MNSNTESNDAVAQSFADMRADHLLRVLQRTRTVLYTAMMDGTVRNTLWANADQSLLDYLDQQIAMASYKTSIAVNRIDSESGSLEASLWGLVSRPSALERLIYSDK